MIGNRTPRRGKQGVQSGQHCDADHRNDDVHEHQHRNGGGGGSRVVGEKQQVREKRENEHHSGYDCE